MNTTTPPRLSDFTRADLDGARALDFTRFAKCVALSHGSHPAARELFSQRHPHSLHLADVQKTAIGPASTGDATWAGPLAARTLASGFLNLVRAHAVLGRLAAAGARRIPPNVAVAIEAASPSGAWIGENTPIPASAGAFSTATVAIAKIGVLIVVSRELLRLIDPVADRALRDVLLRAVVSFGDQQLLDPDVAELAGTRPASITNGAASIAASGTTAAAALADIKALFVAFFAVNQDAERPALVMSPKTATMLALATTSTTLTASGGTLLGVEVITSSAAANRVIMLDPSAIVFAEDDNALAVDVSEHATIQMDDDPLTAAVETSLFQANLSALKIVRYVTWRRLRTSSVHVLTGASYM